jgi:hypothetical protein
MALNDILGDFTNSWIAESGGELTTQRDHHSRILTVDMNAKKYRRVETFMMEIHRVLIVKNPKKNWSQNAEVGRKTDVHYTFPFSKPIQKGKPGATFRSAFPSHMCVL